MLITIKINGTTWHINSYGVVYRKTATRLEIADEYTTKLVKSDAAITRLLGAN